mgnify:CR=1 FL=1
MKRTPTTPTPSAVTGRRYWRSLDELAETPEFRQWVEREFPEVKRPIDDFHKVVARVDGQLDSLLDRDLVLPPETFLERQRFSRLRKPCELVTSTKNPAPSFSFFRHLSSASRPRMSEAKSGIAVS